LQHVTLNEYVTNLALWLQHFNKLTYLALADYVKNYIYDHIPAILGHVNSI